MGTVQGRLFVDGLRSRHRRGGGFGGSARRSRRGRGDASSIATLATVGSALQSISENELLHSDDASRASWPPPVTQPSIRDSDRLVSTAGEAIADEEHDYIMANPDAFTMDKNGFLVPRES